MGRTSAPSYSISSPNPDRFTGFRGLAGTGKSTTLVELDHVLRHERFEPLFCAPTTSSAGSFDVGQVRELKVAPGETLLVQANAPRFVNGGRVQVRTIRGGLITLNGGRQLPAEFNAFTHGHAVTSHSSQGRTVDEVLLVASSRSLGAVNCKQFYVSMWRSWAKRVHGQCVHHSTGRDLPDRGRSAAVILNDANVVGAVHRHA